MRDIHSRGRLIWAVAPAVVGCISVLVACEEPPPPDLQIPTPQNSLVIEQPFDDVWAYAVPALGRSFFSVRQIAKDSGFVELEYAGDPQNMVTCRMKNYCGRGDTDCVTRPQLNGQMNIVFTKITEQATRVTVNARYDISTSYVNDDGQPIQAHTQFNTGQLGNLTLPELADSQCVATGNLENQVVQLLTPSGAFIQAPTRVQPIGQPAASAPRPGAVQPEPSGPMRKF